MASKTSLSVGSIIYDILTKTAEISKTVTAVFPIVSDNATLPYIAYRRSGLEPSPVKNGHSADTVVIDVRCFAAHYSESVELAEAVRAALDCVKAEKDGLIMRSCTLAGSEEYFEGDAFVQELNFNIKV
jgi:hypothetical protein